MDIDIIRFKDENKQKISYDKNPDTCPFCHKNIIPKSIIGFQVQDDAEIIFRCPNSKCQSMFIGYYIFAYKGGSEYRPQILAYKKTSIGNLIPMEFSENITGLSSEFVEIYNEASAAENYNLTRIAGMGYRKSLEFLIKDYLISKSPGKVKEFKAKLLGQCIKEDIENPSLKDMAKRAAWLGNDETHYTRKWNDKDVSDLKLLIKITIHWMEMELSTLKYREEMS